MPRVLPPQKSSPIRLLVLIGLLVATIFGGDELAFRLRLQRSVNTVAPDEDFMEYVKAHPQRLDRTLRAFWRRGGLAHRRAVLHLIKFPGTPEQRFRGIGDFDPYLLAGANSRDLGVRIPALQLLAQHRHPRWREIVAGQFADPDPHLRVLAMRLFRQRGVTNVLPLVAAQLDNPAPYLACNAVIWLQDATGIDHGMESRWISNRILLSAEERQANHEAYTKSLAAAQAWWREVEADCPEFPEATIRPVQPPAVSVPQPTLVDHAGEPFDLEPFAEQPTLYYFFTVWKASPFSEADDLNALQEQAGDSLAILGVALDAVPDEHNENQHSDLIPGRDDEPVVGWGGHGHHGHDHDHHGHDHGPALEFADISRRVMERSAAHGYRFPIAFDVSGDFVTSLQAGDVPCFALVDSRHRLLRRFARGRSPHAVLAMLDHERSP